MNLERQAERLLQYCEARGYQVSQVVKEIASGVNDKEDLIADLVAIVSRFTARLSGQRRAKRKTERMVQELEAEDAPR